jgi:hypothetical protein
MKTFVVLAVSIVLVGILFCPMVMAATPMPDDLQIVQPDPSLPKEISAFSGKWDGGPDLFIIVEKIDEEKAGLYIRRRSGSGGYWPEGWTRSEAKVSKERGKYILWFPGPAGITELTVKGEYLDLSFHGGPFASIRLKRVP